MKFTLKDYQDEAVRDVLVNLVKARKRWREDADEAFVLGFEGLAGAELERLGYRLSGFKAPAALRGRILIERLRPRNPSKHYTAPERPGPAGGDDER